jgi:hypothetical protein
MVYVLLITVMYQGQKLLLKPVYYESPAKCETMRRQFLAMPVFRDYDASAQCVTLPAPIVAPGGR